MSLSKLSKLPPEVLSCVLNNQAIPLGRRLRLRLLCNLWADIIEDGLKKETSLVIRDEKAGYLLKPKPDDLIIKSSDLTDEFIGPLSRLFTSLTQLTINFEIEASLNPMPSLLAHLDTTNLTTVKLYSSLYAHEPIEPIAAALTDLSGLTSLTLFGFRLGSLLLPHLQPVLSRLEKFGCVGDRAGIHSSSLSPRCTHLWLDGSDFQSNAISLRVELSSNLTHLHLFNCYDTIWQSISQMHGLSRLTLNFVCPALDSSFFSQLTPFPRLTQVKLLRLKYHAPLALPSKKEASLVIVKRLTLEVYFGKSPVDYPAFFSAISAWFPALLHLSIITEQGTIPAIRASLGKLPFFVMIVDRDSVDTWAVDW